jgi:RNA polymerase-binding transcription factor DksA
MNKTDLDYFKKKLEEQEKELEEELASVSKTDPNAPGGFEATSGGMETDSADDNEVADKFEEVEDNIGVVKNLETELAEVRAALDRIKTGKYGICENSGKPIERERLEANPSARTSIKHSK